jgi:formylglycine-generating enzyme required for sulfatase activity
MSIKIIFAVIIGLSFYQLEAQTTPPFRLPDTGQTISYTSTPGEDADFIINPQSFTENGDGTITDNITGLMWQKTDGGEMIVENAALYCKNLTLGNYKDWRLPTGLELFSINTYSNSNPALNTTYFTKTPAEYWWSSEVRVDAPTYIWVVNAGGGIGAHLKTETKSAGGTRLIHVRAVRNPTTITLPINHFTDNGNGTITDNYTGLIWQKIQPTNTMTWEEALLYSKTLSLGDKTDWRIPNVKELQSLNDVKLFKPSFDKKFFVNSLSGNYWSSTTLLGTTTKAWDINLDYGIVSYNDKTLKENVLLVRGGVTDKTDVKNSETLIPSGEMEMGDHFGFVDPAHPSDELPLHKVKISSFYMAKTETTNQQFLDFLTAALSKATIEVKNNIVYFTGTSEIVCYTNKFESWYSIGYDGKVFSIIDFRANHPMVGVMWNGVTAFCNWMSSQNGLQECYNLKTWECDFTKNGYRLPTEAEWEWAGRGGHISPYFNYPKGNTIDIKGVNLPQSGDPYEIGDYPNTTPVGFYDGKLKLKADYNWPGSATNYQTSNGANDYGLYDMQGNVWEFVNDWYGQNYYSTSIYQDPKGPTSGFIMPDGKPYRGMRGGNWYNGLVVDGVNDGHSRVSNRNPSYYRGPQDPNHPYYHLGFRVARNYTGITTGLNELQNSLPDRNQLFQNYPNPFNTTTTIQFNLPTSENVTLKIYNSFGQMVAILVNKKLNQGQHSSQWNAENCPCGIYTCELQVNNQVFTKKMILIK